jgi:hypothetical protein
MALIRIYSEKRCTFLASGRLRPSLSCSRKECASIRSITSKPFASGNISRVIKTGSEHRVLEVSGSIRAVRDRDQPRLSASSNRRFEITNQKSVKRTLGISHDISVPQDEIDRKTWSRPIPPAVREISMEITTF